MPDLRRQEIRVPGLNEPINPVRREFFSEARPASTLVEVSALAIPGRKVEIEAVVGLPA
jgi:enamine deaminase RidA (YjgF/YER057c/UK114 family)